MFIGLSYDNNAFDEVGYWESVVRPEVGTGNGISYASKSVAYENYTFKLGPSIRYMGLNLSYYFNPFVSMTLHNMADLYIDLYQNDTFIGGVALQGEQDARFGFGFTNSLSIHLGKASELLFGLEFMWVEVNPNAKITSTIGQSASQRSRYEAMRLTPQVGYRFNL